MKLWEHAIISIHYVVCDECSVGCDAHEQDVRSAVLAARGQGWKRKGNQILCPECQTKVSP